MKFSWRQVIFPGLIFLLAGTAYAVGAATRAGVPGMVFDAIREQLGFSAAATAGIANAGVLGCLVFIAFAGGLIDRFGWKKSILVGIVLQAFGEYWVYSSSDVFAIYWGAFLNGGGRTIGYLTLLKFLDTEFDRKYFSVLIGGFYAFSYAGTLLGSGPFARAAEQFPWQKILEHCNTLTLVCGLGIAILLTLKKGKSALPSPESVGTSVQEPRFSLRDFWASVKTPSAIAAIYTAACGIAIYWAVLVFAAKYLKDLCGVPADILGVMNGIVMLEMIFGGALSFLCGNRRKAFQVFGAVLIFVACIALLLGACVPSESALPFAWVGLLALGLGYGMTCVNIIAVREYVPARFSASAIGLVNFCGNVVMIAMTQLGGVLFDRFPGVKELQSAPIAYAILFAVFTGLSGIAVFAASRLREANSRAPLSA